MTTSAKYAVMAYYREHRGFEYHLGAVAQELGLENATVAGCVAALANDGTLTRTGSGVYKYNGKEDPKAESLRPKVGDKVQVILSNESIILASDGTRLFELVEVNLPQR